jgi:putative endonuclease
MALSRKSQKQKSYDAGIVAEFMAGIYLMARGYWIIKRRYKTSGGEIDIIARRGKVVAMIEVKRRADVNAALESVSPKNRRRVVNAARYFLAAHPQFNNMHVRFDIIAVGWPFYWRHLDNAWQAEA